MGSVKENVSFGVRFSGDPDCAKDQACDHARQSAEWNEVILHKAIACGRENAHSISVVA